jgi:hypothetical protein
MTKSQKRKQANQHHENPLVVLCCINKMPSPDVKRRRISATVSTSQGTNTCFSDLPSGILAHAANFLAKPSKALFAIALDEITPNEERSSAIVGNEWDLLDFGHVEKELAANLLDSDIERVLLCIDAVHKIKRLKLTNCTNITGTCLEPLRGSAVIEQIDLSEIYDTHQPYLNLQPLISLDHVLPILDSIIEREGCALVHLHFPSMWREAPSTESEFHAFIERYNDMRRNRGAVRCLECNEILPSVDGKWIVTNDRYYGTQTNTCYGCLKHYCYGCDDEGDVAILHICDTCQRDYCKGCLEMTYCSDCSGKMCNDCCKYECVKCDEEFCSKCVEKGNFIKKCKYCNKCYCRGCNKNDEKEFEIYECIRCDGKCCNDCLLQKFRQEKLHCTKCIYRSVAMSESLERKELQDDNKQLKVETEELKLENEVLRSKLT